jgi:hypothetical protein
MDPAMEPPIGTVALAHSLVETIALTHLRRMTSLDLAPQETHLGQATVRLRGARPVLSFPADAPGHVRFGLAIEAGVQWPGGRILSADGFVLATVTPVVTRDVASWRLTVSFATAQIETLTMRYAGADLPPEPVRPSHGLPDDDEIASLDGDLRSAIMTYLATLPELPLTPSFPGAPELIQSVIQNEPDRLLIGLDTMALPMLPATHNGNMAIAITVETLARAFAEVLTGDALDDALPGWTVAALQITGAQDRLWLVVRAASTDLPEEELRGTIETQIALGEGVMHFENARVLTEQPQTASEQVAAFGKALRSASFLSRLAQVVQAAVIRAANESLGEAREVWQWRFTPPEPMASLIPTFAAQSVRVAGGAIVLEGALAFPRVSEPISDTTIFDLRQGEPRLEEDEQVVTISVTLTNAQAAPPPVDVAWWNGATPAMQLEHSSTCDVRMRLNDEDPDDTLPRYMSTRELPIGVTTVRAALIDAYGRVTEDSLDVDIRPETVTALPTLRHPLPQSMGEALTIPDTRAAMTAMDTRMTTTRMPVAQVQARSSLIGMLAGALAAFSLVAALAALILTKTISLGGVPTTTVHVQSTSTAISHQATPPGTPAPTIAPTNTITPAPTATPVPFGRFIATPTTLQFSCTMGATTPMNLELGNTGNGTIHWQVSVFGNLGTAPGSTGSGPWASVAPSSGQLAAAQSMVVSVTANPGFCAAPNSSTYLLQFVATQGSAVPLNVPGSHT